MRSWNDDPFTKRARQENYLARSVYKLEEMDRKEHLFADAKFILDLGAAPGSWTQYCLQRIKNPQAKFYAIDIAPIQLSDPRLTKSQSDIETVDLADLINQNKMDVVLSDMAPKTSGVHECDVARSFELADKALEIAETHLNNKGVFVAKLFMGDSFEEFHRKIKSAFQTVRIVRPESTRKHSREIFFIGKQLKQPTLEAS